MAECIVGDITPYCGVSKEEKHTKEKVRAIVDVYSMVVKAALNVNFNNIVLSTNIGEAFLYVISIRNFSYAILDQQFSTGNPWSAIFKTQFLIGNS